MAEVVKAHDPLTGMLRHGYLPERDVKTGIGAVPVRCPWVRDRSHSAIHFHLGIVLSQLLGPDVPGLSATTMSWF